MFWVIEEALWDENIHCMHAPKFLRALGFVVDLGRSRLDMLGKNIFSEGVVVHRWRRYIPGGAPESQGCGGLMLDLEISEVFSNVNDSLILPWNSKKTSPQQLSIGSVGLLHARMTTHSLNSMGIS